MLLFPGNICSLAMNILARDAQSLGGVAMGPFLMDNSHEEERTYLFSISSGMRMTAVSIGQWIGGYLPTWFALRLAIDAMDTQAYSLSLWTVSLSGLLAVIPMLLVVNKTNEGVRGSVFAPLSFIRRNPGKFEKLILPSLVTSVGAGLVMPFMNVFFRTVHHQSDTSIGTYFAWGAGVGSASSRQLAERSADRSGVIYKPSQYLSWQFWVSAPRFGIVWPYMRTMLMNMAARFTQPL